MTMVLTIDGKYVTDLCTNTAWYEFAEWAREQKGYELRHLAYHGWTDKADKLYKQLKSADPFAVGGNIESVAQALMAAVSLHQAMSDPEAVVVVSDGFGEGEEGD